MASRQRIQGALRDFLRNAYLWRSLIALVGMASMTLPWVYLDGAESSLSGAELIAYTFVTGSERWDMIKESVLGAASLFLVPPVVGALSIAVFVSAFRDRDCVMLNAFAGLLPLLIVIFSGSITSSEHLIGGRLVFPQAGIIVMFLSQAALAIHSLRR